MKFNFIPIMNNVMSVNIKDKDFRQFIRYVMVGVMNTLVTLVVIFLCKSIIGVNPWVSNAIGYVAGVINSFFWNKHWVFRSGGDMRGEMIRFMVGFGVCYAIQFAVTWCLNYFIGSLEWDVVVMTVSGYGVATIAGMVMYTLANFAFNRIVTFKNQK